MVYKAGDRPGSLLEPPFPAAQYGDSDVPVALTDTPQHTLDILCLSLSFNTAIPIPNSISAILSSIITISLRISATFRSTLLLHEHRNAHRDRLLRLCMTGLFALLLLRERNQRNVYQTNHHPRLQIL